MPNADRTAQRTSDWEFHTFGCIVQLVGIPLLFAFPLGTMLGLLMILGGGGFRPRSRCGACRSLLPSKEAVVCAACGADLVESEDS